jgi:phosphoglycerate dehydrogenase-like enzyme
MGLLVHLTRPAPAAALTQFQASLRPEIRLTLGPDLPVPAEYHILVDGRPQRDHLLASPNLSALVVPWAGLPEATRDLMQEFPQIPVHNLHHNARPVAEMAIALMLAAAKTIVPADRALRAGDWRPRYRHDPSLLLAGRTALILGYGAVGRHVANLCRALGMVVVATRRGSGEPPEGPDEIHPATALGELLPRADVLIICLPLTPQTEDLIAAAELVLLPPGAVLVNVGRGRIVNEAALYHALRDGRLLAAGLDTWYNYPADPEDRASTPPSAFPFHELDNVVMSPHRAGHSDQTEHLRMTHLARLLNAAAAGEPMPNRVDLAAGY